jgi:hypothetical protein
MEDDHLLKFFLVLHTAAVEDDNSVLKWKHHKENVSFEDFHFQRSFNGGQKVQLAISHLGFRRAKILVLTMVCNKIAVTNDMP